MEKFIQDIAKKAGGAVLKRFGKDGVQYMKSKNRGDAVTKADLLSEKMIIDAIKKRYPEHGIVAEESGTFREGSEYVWVIDPIDGTLNFAHGVPIFGVMICLMRSGEVILSVIYMPALKQLFFAKKGKGTFLNGTRVRCAKTLSLKGSVGCGSSSLRTRMAHFFKKLIKAAKDGHMLFSSPGSICANASYVAKGGRDWMVALVGGVHDFAPISLILSEAGCAVTDTKGRSWKFGMLEMVAANPTLHKQLLKLTKDI